MLVEFSWTSKRPLILLTTKYGLINQPNLTNRKQKTSIKGVLTDIIIITHGTCPRAYTVSIATFNLF